MNEKEFREARQNAITEMYKMNNRNTNTPPNTIKENSPFSKRESQQKRDTSLLGNLNIPFLENFKSDGDLTLIVGILLLLLSEKADKRLLFALIYILL